MTDDLIRPGELVEPGREAAARGLRTLLQGAAVSALGAVVTVVHDAANSGTTDYRAVAVLAGQAVLTAVATYVHNRLRPAV
ncbi:hypothetical protein [Thermomonospora umbrina]|uniref:Uncharacterized protein n=1 Tax=Thermomonospora umbrina TaxID=111806 RepID=A0A3D9SGW1_9ACTN|nr:hypothetical protein [Thermomonospora umbrina]REE95148.1 hypothetical protein DFJ69_0530 [Thermomonospora umbrina]